MRRINLQLKGYATEENAVKAIEAIIAKHPDVAQIRVLFATQNGRVHPVFLPLPDQLQYAIAMTWHHKNITIA